MGITHVKVSAIADDAAAAARGEVLPSDWNAAHTITSLMSGDGSQVLVAKNTNVDNADNGDLRVSAAAYDINAISGRWNQVYRLGYNMAASGIGYDAGEPSMGIQWESFYEQGGAELLEWHQSVFKPDNSEVRFESWAIDRSTYEVSKASSFDVMAWYDSSSVTKFAEFSWSAGVFYVTHSTAHNSYWRFNNAVPNIQQRNAANNAYINLPYINGEDRLYAAVPAAFQGATPTTGSWANQFLSLAPTSGVNGGVCLAITGPTVTGSYDFVQCVGSYQWDATIEIRNTYGSNGSSARLRISGVAGGADLITLYQVTSATDWCSGIDNSDSDSFVIAKNTLPGTNNALRIDTSLNSRFYGNLGIANAANGQACEIKTLTELLTIAAAATSTTTIQKPANSIILAVPVRVTTAVTCTSTFTVGDAGSATRFSTAAVSKAANTTDKGTKAGAYYNATAEGIVITPDTVPSDATGRVRVTIYYIELTPPTS